MKRHFPALKISSSHARPLLVRALCAAYIGAAGFSPLMAAAYDPGYVPYGRIADRTPVVTNAWQAVSNKTHSLIEKVAPVPGAYATVSNAAMNAISRAEIEAGFTEWVMPDGAESRYYIDYFNNSWVLRNISDDEPVASEYAPTDAVTVTFSEDWLIPNPLTITRTRLPTMSNITDITTQLVAKVSTNDVQKFAYMDGTSNGRRFKKSFGKNGSSYQGSGMRYVDEYLLGGLFGMDYGTKTYGDYAHFKLWTQELDGEDDETNEYFAVYAQLPYSMKDGSIQGADQYVFAPGMRVPGEYGQIPWFALQRAVDAYGRVGSVFSESNQYILHTWSGSDSREIELHHPNVGYVNSAVAWVTNYIAQYGKVYGATVASNLVDRTGALVKAEDIEERAAHLTATSVVPVFVYSAWTSDWPSDDDVQPLQPVWSNGTWSVTLKQIEGVSEYGPYSIAGAEDALTFTVSIMGYATTFNRTATSIGDRNAYGLARFSDVTNDVPEYTTNDTWICSNVAGDAWKPEWTGSNWFMSVINITLPAEATSYVLKDESSPEPGLGDFIYTRISTSSRNALGLARLTDLTTATNDLHKSIAPTIPSTNGFVTASITNGFVTASITNGLASTSITNGFVTASITNGLVTASITNGLATTSITNGFVTASITNGLVTASITNGLVTASITNGLATTTYADSAASSAASSAVDSADTSYPRYTTITNLNQSVQYVSITDPSPSTLAITIPTNGATKDWIVYVTAVTNVSLSLPPATYWMADTAYTNDIAPATPTALYFSEATSGVYVIGRQELTPITIAQP